MALAFIRPFMNLNSKLCTLRPSLLIAPTYVLTFKIKATYSSDQDKKELRSWRVPWSKRAGEWYSAFSLFAPEKGNSPDLIRFLQTPIDLRPSKIRSWWRRKKEEKAILDQRYIEMRHDILGSDLAAAHFVVHRGGSVRFVGQPNWITMDENEDYKLPKTFSPAYVIEAMDLSGMEIHYEGFQNLVHLQKLTWLNLSSCKHIDDWCVDRISGEYSSSLEYLDLSNCHQVTHLSLSAMYRLSKLKTLKLNNIVNSKSFELACLLLEDINPNLSIEGVVYMDVKTIKFEQELSK